MKLYTFPASPNCVMIQMFAAEVGQALDLQTVNLRENEQSTPDYLAINPNGKVPLLQDGDLYLWETSAILHYIAQKHNSPLYPANDVRITQWVSWGQIHWVMALRPYLMENVFKKMRGQDDTDQAVLDAARADFDKYATVLAGQLSKSPYLLGEQITVADILCAAYLVYSDVAQFPLNDYPVITAWRDRVFARPTWKAAATETQAIINSIAA